MTSSLLRPPPRLTPWPQQWPNQRLLLERQHDRLELQLNTLIRRHHPEAPPWTLEEAKTCHHDSRILLRNLKLHLRLEERWLHRWGCLCHGHRQAHLDASVAALEGWLRCDGDRDLRLAWLQALRTWFVSHRAGADARAYSHAHAHAASQP